MEPINFYLGDESRLVIDNFESKNESLFKDSYDKALNAIYDFIQESEKNGTNSDNESASVFFKQTADSVKNNVIAFLGDRGTGKTSCMLSVANMLRKINSCENDKNGEKIKNSCKKGFEILETIDPSFFDEKANVLEVVLGRLFSNFRKKVDDGYTRGFKDNECKKNELFKTFQEVKECLTHMNAEKCVCEEDTAESLLNLTASVDMRNSIENLVKNYLNFVGKDYLVISIDDIDMHTEHAYEMAEEIRKYLKQPKIIVLMALKLEQLEQTIELHFDKIMSEKVVSRSTIVDMALKYVIKFIPENNRIFMPEAKIWYDCVVNVYEESKSGIKKHNNKSWKHYDDGHKEQTVKYYITSMIFQKTRYLFYHSQENASPIVPKNLRELRQLIELLCNMDDYSKERRNTVNQEIFKEYFLNTWMSNNLNINDSKVLTNVFKSSDVSVINKTILSILNDKYKSLLQEQEESDEFNKIMDEKNTPYNISLGDVLFVVNYLKNKLYNFEDKMFLFAIKTFYSIKLYEYYDARTENKIIKDKETINSSIDSTIKKNDILDDFSAYEILVGGSFININKDRLIPTNQQGQRRDLRSISVKVLKDLVPQNSKAKFTKKDIKQIQWIEFFLMFASRLNYTDINKAGFSENTYRTRSEIIYNSQINSGSFWFDTSSLLFNLINLKRQYKRFDEVFCNIVTDSKFDSLYNRILNFCTKNRDVFSTNGEKEENITNHKLLSWVSIRNIDVLEELSRIINYSSIKTKDEKLRFNQEKKSIGNKDLEEIYFYLRWMENFKIFTYDKKEINGEKAPYEINFKFVKELTKFIEDEKNFTSFEKIFNNGYSDFLDYIKDINADEFIDDRIYSARNVKTTLEFLFRFDQDSSFFKKFIDTNVSGRSRIYGKDIKELVFILKKYYTNKYSKKNNSSSPKKEKTKNLEEKKRKNATTDKEQKAQKISKTIGEVKKRNLSKIVSSKAETSKKEKKK